MDSTLSLKAMSSYGRFCSGVITFQAKDNCLARVPMLAVGLSVRSLGLFSAQKCRKAHLHFGGEGGGCSQVEQGLLQEEKYVNLNNI